MLQLTVNELMARQYVVSLAEKIEKEMRWTEEERGKHQNEGSGEECQWNEKENPCAVDSRREG